MGALLLASAPSFCEVPVSCGTTLTQALEDLRANVTPSQILEFFDSLSGPGSGTLRELMELAGVEKVRFARRPWITQTRIKGRKLVLPYPKVRTNEDLARTYLSIFAPLRLRALRKTTSPFTTGLRDYQRRTAEILARSEFQAYDILFYLAPHFLENDVTEEGIDDLSFRDRRRLAGGRLPSFVMPSVTRAMNGWANADPSNEAAAVEALDANVHRERLNFLWFGDTERRLKRSLWSGVRYATIASGLFTLWHAGPELVLLWNAREQIYQSANISGTVPLKPEALAAGKRDMHRFYLRRIEETQKILDVHPRASNALADMDYYRQRARETSP